MENKAKWSIDQTNTKRMVYNIKKASLPEGYLCLFSRQMIWGSLLKDVEDTSRL